MVGCFFFFLFTFLRYWLKITLHPCCPLLTLLCARFLFFIFPTDACVRTCVRERGGGGYIRCWYDLLALPFCHFDPILFILPSMFSKCVLYTPTDNLFIYFCIFMQSPVSNKLNLLHICLTFEVRSPFHNTSLYFLNLWTASPFIPWPLRFCFCASDQVSQF